MKVTTQDIGLFFAALGQQMIVEAGVSAGAVIANARSRSDIVARMSIGGLNGYYAEKRVATALVRAAANSHCACIASWLSAFGEIEV